uniref:Uncharacterized protein n=1 Tax=Pyramimonas orientalis virus TaxID=455367 RepID=A0A7M3UNU1_POV01|nr:hypothetical protein HWQ62_00239 [Pyramimonas orientalis virus]
MNIEEICTNFFSDNKSQVPIVLLSYQRQTSHSKATNHPTQFKNFLINSSEFKTHFNKIFDEVFGYIFKSFEEIDCENSKKTYVSACLKEITIFDKQGVMEFLKTEKLFGEYYQNVVETMYTFYFSDKMEDKKLDKAIAFARDIDFIHTNGESVEKKLKGFVYGLNNNDVVHFDESSFLLEEHKQHFVDLYKSKYSVSPDNNALKEFNTFMEQKKRVVEMYFDNRFNTCTVFYTAIIKTFHDVFKRDITVFEYVKYYPVFSESCENNISLYHANFSKKKNIVSNIFNNYLNTKIDYLEFIGSFLEYLEIDDETFTNKTIDIVINYTKYKMVMYEKVKTIYNQTYASVISELDLQYFFEKILDNKFNLIDENLSKLITKLKEETDTYMETINNIFKTILERCTDTVEMDTYIMYFRYPNDANLRPTIRLENEVYESLEYHDILKKLITTRYSKHLQTRRSDLYKMLNVVLKCPNAFLKREKTKMYELLESEFSLCPTTD